ncbi:hypothetical protein [Caulobacter sp. X]|uniref:hypothetical protein n=1 Tax=Caulobacter sp. X TaxID=2048901 RepID=UPI000C145776|nr:hypothetical protein [Caulobacter sp. X]PIB96502.1 hypothetical protein CSW60_18515 [Caulobacter sp. X]
MKVQGDPTATPIGGFLGYDLAAGVTISAGQTTAPVEGVAAGSYLLAILATNWNGATIKLKFLGPDGVTNMDAKDAEGNAASLSANGHLGVVVGGNATLCLEATGGAPTGVYASIS